MYGYILHLSCLKDKPPRQSLGGLSYRDIHHIAGANTHKLKSTTLKTIHIMICAWAFFSRNASDGFCGL